MQISLEHKIKYLNRRVTEIEELKSGLSHDDFDLATSIGHRLKGNGETFGYPLISHLGEVIERAALLKDKEKLGKLIEDLESNIKENLRLIQ